MTPSTPVPLLAAAARRLREAPPAGYPGRPGRPRKHPRPEPSTGTARAQGPEKAAESPAKGAKSRSATPGQGGALQPLSPRLLDVRAAAGYLGVSTWTIRDLDGAGRLPRVRLTIAGRDCRRLLYDVRDLDRLIDVSKDSTEPPR